MVVIPLRRRTSGFTAYASKASVTFASFSGLTGWWDASQEGYANDATVTSLTDRSGNSRTVNNGGAPTFKTNIQNGKPGVLFDGTDDLLEGTFTIGDLMTASAGTAIAVFKVVTFGTDASAPHENDAVWADENAYTALYLRSDTSRALAFSTDSGGQDIVEAGVVGTGAHVVSWRHSGGTLYAAVDGGTENSVASGDILVTVGPMVFGADFSHTRYANLYLFELGFYNVSLGSSDQASLVSSLRSKWGI